MARRVSPLLAPLWTAVVLASISACSIGPKPQRPAWRTQAENACLAEKRVRPSTYAQISNEIDGPGICGMTKPFKVTALQGGAVAFNATATLDCSMVAELDSWLTDVVQPAAQARFGQNVVQINSMGSYSCRGMNGQRGAPLSEHSFGNALDIGGFVLADAREISIVRDWTRGDEQTRAFLMDVHAGSCQRFTTVLSPGSNLFHYNHIHVDLALHGRNGQHICKPVPQETAPPPGQLPALIARTANPPGVVEDDDSDTGEQPPRAAFDGQGVGARESFGPLDIPLPPRRDVGPRPRQRNEDVDFGDGDLTSSIRSRSR
jgi:hypothetical protein